MNLAPSGSPLPDSVTFAVYGRTLSLCNRCIPHLLTFTECHRETCYFYSTVFMSQPRAYSLPVNQSLPERQRKPRGSIFRRLARAIRKKRTQSSDDLAATGASWTISESPQPLTPSTSLDSLDDLLEATSSSQAEALTSAEPFLEILKEVKPLLQCLQSTNKTSQVSI